jgi:hypothetical protein
MRSHFICFLGNCPTGSIFDIYNHSLRYSYVKMQFNAETDFIFLSYLMLFDMTREAKTQYMEY